MNGAWQIRTAEPADAAGIVAVFNPIIETGQFTSFTTPFSTEAERAYIENMGPRDIFHVAVAPKDGIIVGFQSMSPFPSATDAFAHVGTLGTFVALDRRRQGIASALFPTTIHVARELGYEKLFTYVRADNPAGLLTYLNHGFRVVGTAERQAKIRGQYVDEHIIERLL